MNLLHDALLLLIWVVIHWNLVTWLRRYRGHKFMLDVDMHLGQFTTKKNSTRVSTIRRFIRRDCTLRQSLSFESFRGNVHCITIKSWPSKTAASNRISIIISVSIVCESVIHTNHITLSSFSYRTLLFLFSVLLPLLSFVIPRWPSWLLLSDKQERTHPSNNTCYGIEPMAKWHV